jgi:hypothetical protein
MFETFLESSNLNAFIRASVLILDLFKHGVMFVTLTNIIKEKVGEYSVFLKYAIVTLSILIGSVVAILWLGGVAPTMKYNEQIYIIIIMICLSIAIFVPYIVYLLLKIFGYNDKAKRVRKFSERIAKCFDVAIGLSRILDVVQILGDSYID